MAHFLIVANPHDGVKRHGSVTAFNMKRVQTLLLTVGEEDLFAVVNDVVEPLSGPELISTLKFQVSSESEVMSDMQAMLAELELGAERRKEATDGQAPSE
jgi:hypothetical protein